ncbi:hypothetical protein FIM10_10900 [Sphingomonadales bacterium 56]|jgi:hypothetical protein|uniref:Uncharacterized protein n=1 Tax=Sphingobium agri TaxID=2933566 RepID=A0ABT0DUE4_9SPHN|nr:MULTISPECIES: hypothetical protein [Sphingomonadaceae]MBY2929183.1 hypothetical protein [Sphingomonadales bacterium 56]MBY2958905.1 hypothetical protein [Sphingomonadales bacterium 58]MCK0530741.1 hypothetical protein [Sphingobium agri]CAD7338026.1 hypothetical protein SPHS8_01852 [Sphingobium sp. S8]CAD7338949.1 hypothetical protein SPHS6_02201 [Sphingobium sp. S6]
MSRVVNLTASVAEVERLCRTHDFRISTIEPLLSGGSRVVLLDGREADQVRVLMKKQMISGDVKRSPAHVSRQPPPSYRTR